MSKEIFCNECNEKIGELSKGSTIKKDAIFFCGKCNYQRLLEKNDSTKNIENPFGDIFNDIFNGKK